MISRTKYFVLAFLLFFCGVINATNPIPDVPTDFAEEQQPLMDSLTVLMSELLNDYPTFSDDDYRQRLEAISGIIEYRLDPLVKSRIQIRTEKYRASTERLLGKSDMYFPIFEEHLAKHNVPHHLKYLSIIESHLNPVAKSVASAVGLWQFIPSSGRLFGLKINSYVDERSDTYKASEAAAKLLRTLYDKYGDWALSMAAYNCGPGRVNQAIKKAGGSTNYWKVRKFLPRETQKYVPYFMAMVYVGEFHAHHNMKPTKMPQNLVLTDTIHIAGGLALKDLAKELEVSMDTLKILNPAYRRNYIPKNKQGQIIILPASTVAQIRGYQNAFNRILGLQKDNPIRAVRRIQTYKDLEWLAKAYRCRIEDILFWNELPSNYEPYSGDLIAIRKYNTSKDVLKKKQRKLEQISIPSLRVVGLDEKQKAKTSMVYLRAKANKTVAAAVNPSSRMKAMNRATISALRKKRQHKTVTPSVPKAGSREGGNQRVVAASRNDLTSRARGRRFRNYGFVSTENNEEEASKGYPIESSYMEGSANKNTLELSREIPHARELMDGQTTKKKRIVQQKATSKSLINGSSKSSKSSEEVNKNIDIQKEATAQERGINLPSRKRARNIRKTPINIGIAKKTFTKKKVQISAHPLAQKYAYHKVNKGETIWDIQKNYSTLSVREIMEENQLDYGKPLHTGQILKLRIQK